MAPQAPKLGKIELDDFALLNERYGRPGRPPYAQQAAAAAPRAPAELGKIGLEGFALVDEIYGRRVPPRAPAELRKIGLEGFALVDEMYGRPARRPHHNQYYQYQAQKDYQEDTVVDCFEAAQLHGGILIMDCRKRKPSRKGY